VKRRAFIVRHPAGSAGLLGPTGIGPTGPAAPGGGLLGPAVPQLPSSPGNPAGQVPGRVANDALAPLAGALQAGLSAFSRDAIGAGAVLLGAVLVVVGLLLATGQGGRVAGVARRAAGATPPGRVLGLLR